MRWSEYKLVTTRSVTLVVTVPSRTGTCLLELFFCWREFLPPKLKFLLPSFGFRRPSHVVASVRQSPVSFLTPRETFLLARSRIATTAYQVPMKPEAVGI